MDEREANAGRRTGDNRAAESAQAGGGYSTAGIGGADESGQRSAAVDEFLWAVTVAGSRGWQIGREPARGTTDVQGIEQRRACTRAHFASNGKELSGRCRRPGPGCCYKVSKRLTGSAGRGVRPHRRDNHALRRYRRSGLRLSTASRCDNFLGRVFHPGRPDETKARVLNHLATLFYIGSFQPDNDRDLNADLARSLHDTLRDHIGSNDSAKDINKNGAHLRVG